MSDREQSELSQPTQRPVLSEYIEKFSKLNLVAHEQERQAREEFASDDRKWLEREIGRLLTMGKELSELLTEARNERDMYKQQRADWKAAYEGQSRTEGNAVMRMIWDE